MTDMIGLRIAKETPAALFVHSMDRYIQTIVIASRAGKKQGVREPRAAKRRAAESIDAQRNEDARKRKRAAV